MAMSPVCQE